jgi:GT2 family glycosyltransferase
VSRREAPLSWRCVTTPQAVAGPRVSLLMPNRNNEPALHLVLGRLAQHTTYPNVELIVVDDGSSDRSREILGAWRDSGRFPGEMRLIEQEPSGVVDALNAGLRAAKGEIVVQLDSDASVETADWLQRMLALFLSHPTIGVVTPKLIMDSGLVHAYGVNAIGPAGLHDRGTEVAEPIGRRRLHQRVRRFRERPGDLGERTAEVDCGIGCCMMYRRDVALEVGGYDPGWQPVWFDDLDLCLAIRRAGYKVFFLPDVRVIHRLSLRRTSEDTRSPLRRRAGNAAGHVLRRLPPRLHERIVHAANLDRPPPEHLERLHHHYAYWREKWGWDPLNPDMESARERYGDTELWWARDPARRAAGEEIVAAFETRRDHTSAAFNIDRDLAYHRRFGFLPPPRWSMLTGYEHILDVILERRLHELDGDLVEIGVFLGGGIQQLARLWERLAPDRKVLAVDLFELGADHTPAATGIKMDDIYRTVLGGHDQRAVYDLVVAECRNVQTISGDSTVVDIPTERISFAHIDGNHDPAYVRSDFERLWPKVAPGGVVAFDDYGLDLPDVTATVDALRAERAPEIADFWTSGIKTAFLEKAQ